MEDFKIRCTSCDVALSDYESTIKSTINGEYLDLCMQCLSTIPDISYIDRPDLLDISDIVVDEGTEI